MKKTNHMKRLEAISDVIAKQKAQEPLAAVNRMIDEWAKQPMTATADPIDAILTGIRFHRKTDREKLRASIQEYATTRVNQMHGHLTMKHGEETKAQYVTIEKLKRELQRAHDRHVADIVEVYDRYPFFDTAGKVARP